MKHYVLSTVMFEAKNIYEMYENIVGIKEDSTILAILLAISNIKAEFNYYLNGVMEQLS